jgi:uncharacterized membrane protein
VTDRQWATGREEQIGILEPRLVVNPALTLLAAVVGGLLLANVVTTGFAKLGLAEWAVGAILLVSIVGSMVNIPIYARTSPTAEASLFAMGNFVFHRHPQVEHQVLAVNVGGALVPIGLSAWLLTRAPLLETLVATAVVALVSHQLARVVKGEGIELPALIPPLVAVGLAWLLTGGRDSDTAAIAYVAGSMGTLIGADLWNIRRFGRVGSGVVSIGGAGVVDGVFLAGILAAVIA